MKRFAITAMPLIAALWLSPSVRAITIDTVLIGNPGNAADVRYPDSTHPSGIGAVGQAFNIGTTEVTNAQYVAMLNAVAASDPYKLYSTSMGSATQGGIVRSGASGSYIYAIKAPAQGGAYAYENKPVVFASAASAMRFANWLHNGQPTGVEDATTTEDGAYTLNGAILTPELSTVTRNSNARWWLPSENEWYKAAYYNPVGGVYYDYPTGTNDIPNNNLPNNDTGNSANYYDLGYTTGDFSFPLTNAGAYALSRSPYGTLDQGGSLWEWNETIFNSFVHLRGGSWRTQTRSPPYLRANSWYGLTPANGDNDVGFRVATTAVPEPSLLATLSCGWAGYSTFFGNRRLRKARRR